MDTNDQVALREFEDAKKKLLRGVWTSPDTTPKKTNWYVQCHNSQVAGQPQVGRVVFVTKSRQSFQLVELVEKYADSVDKSGLPISLWVAKVLA